MARKSSSRIKICVLASVFSIFGRLWDPLGTILARGNPSPEAPKAVGTFESIDLDGPEALWMPLHDFLAQNCKICVNFCIFWDSMAAIFFSAELEFWRLICISLYFWGDYLSWDPKVFFGVFFALYAL